MAWLGEIWRRLMFLLRRRRFDRDLQDEMQFHLEMKARQNQETGMDPDEAAYAARGQFGNRALLQETSRAQWGWTEAESFARDLRYAWRALRRTPAFTAVALLTLTIGIGVNAAMFSLVRAVLLRPLPYRDPARLVMVWRTRKAPDDPQFARPRRSTPPAQLFARWRARSRSLESVAGYSGRYLNLTGGGNAERILALVVTANFFPVLGITPARGRGFLPEEEQPGRGHRVILSDDLWRTHFGADPAILGKTVSLDGESYVIVGVLPAGFQPVLPTVSRRFDLYLPLTLNNVPPVRVLGRLRRGAGVAAAQAEMQAIADGFQQEESPRASYTGVQLTPLLDDVTADARPGLLALAGAVVCVLLIVCINLAALMLAHAAARRSVRGGGVWPGKF